MKCQLEIENVLNESGVMCLVGILAIPRMNGLQAFERIMEHDKNNAPRLLSQKKKKNNWRTSRIADFQKDWKPGTRWARVQLWDRLGGARAFVFKLVRSQTIPQLSARPLSPQFSTLFEVGYYVSLR